MNNRTRVRGSHNSDDPQFNHHHQQAEQTVDAVLPCDPLTDVLAEAIHPERLSAKALERLADSILKGHDPEVEKKIQKRYQTALVRLLYLLEPPRSTVANWYAMHLAIGSESVKDLTGTDVAKMLGISPSAMLRRVKQWRQDLGLPEGESFHRSHAAKISNLKHFRDPKRKLWRNQLRRSVRT